MAFHITCDYKRGAEAERMSIRAQHLTYMIDALPLTLAGGVLLDDSDVPIGMFVLLNVSQRDKAEQFVMHEPYNKHGLVTATHITAVRVATPEPVPNFLQSELARLQQSAESSGR